MAKGGSDQSFHFPKSQLLSFSLIAFLLCNSAVATEAFIPDRNIVSATRACSTTTFKHVPKHSMSEGLASDKSANSALLYHSREDAALPNPRFPQHLRAQGSRFRTPSGGYSRQPAELQQSYHPLSQRRASPSFVGHDPYAPQYHQHSVPNKFQSGLPYPANRVQTNLSPTLEASILPNFSNAQYSHPPRTAWNPSGHYYWNEQNKSWDPMPISVGPFQGSTSAHDLQPPQWLPVKEPSEATPVVDLGKLWEDIDRDIFDLVHNEGVRLPGESELTKQDELLPHNHQPIEEIYPSFYHPHSLPEVSPRKSAPNRLSNKPQPIPRFSSPFRDNQQGLTSTPASNPTAWPVLQPSNPSNTRSAGMEAHRRVYAQALAT